MSEEAVLVGRRAGYLGLGVGATLGACLVLILGQTVLLGSLVEPDSWLSSDGAFNTGILMAGVTMMWLQGCEAWKTFKARRMQQEDAGSGGDDEL